MSGRVMQRHAVVDSPCIGDRLLVKDLGARGTADLRQLAGDGAGLGQGQCFRGLEHRYDLALGDRQARVIRPFRLIDQGDRHAAAGVGDERHHRAGWALIGQSEAWLKKAGQRVVIKLHSKAHRRRDLNLRQGSIA